MHGIFATQISHENAGEFFAEFRYILNLTHTKKNDAHRNIAQW
jgi:hypothetical protein